MNFPVYTERSPAVVESDILNLQREMAITSLDETGEKAARQYVATLTTDALIDPGKIGTLTEAKWALDALVAKNDTCRSNTRKLDHLMQELDAAKARHAALAREAAGKRYMVALNAFNVHALAAANAYRQLINEAKQGGYTGRLPRFDCSTLYPMGWQAPLSDIMIQGTAPFENDQPAQPNLVRVA